MALTADVCPASIATGTDGTLEIFQGKHSRQRQGGRQAKYAMSHVLVKAGEITMCVCVWRACVLLC